LAEQPRILVPTDFSAPSDAALEAAIGLASPLGARIDLLHAYGVPSHLIRHYDVTLPDPVASSIRDAAARRLLERLERLQARGVTGDMQLSEEAPESAIPAHAAQLGADWIVMGTRGLSGLKHVLMGSTAERVLRAAPCPVMTVKQRPKEGPLRLAHIVVPTDLSDASRAALDVARKLAHAAGPSRVSLVHAYEVPSTFEVLLDRRNEPLLQEWSQKLRQTLGDMVAELEADGLMAFFNLSQGPPEQVIRDFVLDEDVDLVVMTTHGRSGLAHIALGSVAERVVRSVPCPVVTIKP
jgi:nucleotide-binding universal stress UspA family protein